MGDGGGDYTQLSEESVKNVINLRVSYKASNFLTHLATISF